MSFQLPGFSSVEKINQSKNNIVFRAVRDTDNEKVIIKQVKAGMLARTSTDLSRDFEVCSYLNKYIPDAVSQALEKSQHEGKPFVVYKDDGARSVMSMIPEGGIEAKLFLELSIACADVLCKLHQQFVLHKDVKPSNFIYNETSKVLKIIDFGISSYVSLKQPALPPSTALEGTLLYISPEQTGRTNQPCDFRSDLYSLGVAMFQMLTGKLPFQLTDPLELVHAHIAKAPILANIVRTEIPETIALIIDKLLKKNPEDRYQSAVGVKKDLEKCLKEITETGTVKAFTLAQNDDIPRFKISQKLYGRENELARLQEELNISVSTKKPVLILVRGYSGCGKSALVQELKQRQTERRLFITGKFDQFKKSSPYSALIDALKSLVNQLLLEDDAELEKLKAQLEAALAGTGQILIDLCSDVAILLGQQPVLSTLGDSEAQARLNDAIIRFFACIAEDRPITLFLDDLQWSDTPSLKLLDAISQAPALSLMIIGAYRDNEVDKTHPLQLVLDEIATKNMKIEYVDVKPLAFKDLNLFIADSLFSSEPSCEELTRAVQQKTEGNPFFTRELLLTMYQEHLINYSSSECKWTWDLSAIQSMQASSNVVDFMLRNLKKMPEQLQKILHYAACVGNSFSLSTLSYALEADASNFLNELLELVKEGWIKEQKLGEKKSYAFNHDRIQAAAYMLLDEEARKRTHVKIGVSMLSHVDMQQLHSFDGLFDVTNHLNVAKDILSAEQQHTLLKLNIEAARKAKESSAFDPCLYYSTVAVSLLDPDSWTNDYSSAFDAHLLCAQANQTCTKLPQAKELYEILKENSKTLPDKTKVYVSYTRMLYNTGEFKEAIETGFKGLGLFQDLQVPQSITSDEQHIGWAMQAKGEIDAIMEGKDLTYIQELPANTEVEYAYLISLCLEIAPVLFSYDDASKMILPMMATLCVKVTLLKGMCDEAPAGIALYAWCVGMIFNEFQKAYQYSMLAMEIANKMNAKDPLAKVISLVGAELCAVWGSSAKTAKKLSDDAILLGVQSGYKTWAGAAMSHIGQHILDSNVPVSQGIEVTSTYLAILEAAQVENEARVFKYTYLLYLQWIKGETIGVDSFSTEDCPEEKLDSEVSTDIAHNKALHFAYRAFAMYLIGNSEKAKMYIDSAEQNLMGVFGLPMFYRFFFYQGIVTTLIISEEQNVEELEKRFKVLETCLEKLEAFKSINPSGFETFYLIVKAQHKILCNARRNESNNNFEILRMLDGAIVSALKNEMDQFAALANEIAGRFCISENLNDGISAQYLASARHYWTLYGATRKAKQLEEMYPKYIAMGGKTVSDSTTSSGGSHTVTSGSGTVGASGMVTETSAVMLDTLTIIKASQALSSEIELDKLLVSFMKIVMENAGASRGCILLQRGSSLIAEVETDATGQCEKINQEFSSYHKVPAAIIKAVSKSSRPVILQSAAEASDFQQDPYIQKAQVKSMLCAPISYKGSLTGILYLENNNVKGAFIPARLQVINILLSQIAISAANALLYAGMKTLNKAYARFLPKEFLNELEKGDVVDVQLSDCIQKNLTILFSDIRSFTTISEKMTPEENFSFLNEYLKRVGPIIRDHHGFIDKFIGDAVMALFPRSPMDAIFAAQSMFEKLEEFNVELAGKYPYIKIGVGLNSGKVMLGTIGETERMEGTVIGDVVNSASRFEALTKTFGADILCSQSTLDALIELKQKQDPSVKEIEYRLIGLFKVKGKEQSLPIYDIYKTSNKNAQQKREFTTALTMFIQKKFKDALAIFSKNANDDAAADYYVPLCESLEAVKEYLPKEWKGEVELDKEGNAQNAFEKTRVQDMEKKIEQLQAQVKKLLISKVEEPAVPSGRASAPPQTFATVDRTPQTKPNEKRPAKSGVCVVQ